MSRGCTPRIPLACAFALLLSAPACGEDRVSTVPPEVAVLEASLAFGRVRVGTPAHLPVTVRSQSRATLTVTSMTVADDPAVPGGASAFQLAPPPESIPGESEVPVALTFTPPALQEYRALVVVRSDDAERPEVQVAVAGRGALPRSRVVPECLPPCAGFVATVSPPAIDFGARPPLRTDAAGRVINEPEWPTVTLHNDGDWPLALLSATFSGDPVFRARQSINPTGVVIDPGGHLAVQVMFDPLETKADWAGALDLGTDDPATPAAQVQLVGTLAPNRAPLVCAAIVEVRQPDGSVDLPRDSTGAPSFGAQVPVQPGDRGRVILSAFSDHFVPGLHPNEMIDGDQSLCTTDPEDGRAVLRYQWTVKQRPAQSAASVLGETSPEPSIQPDAVGTYVLTLEVTDPQGKSASADVTFEAVPMRDLAVQLSWERQPGVDLDVHLVRPGPCGPRPDCVFDKVGDVNGYSAAKTGGVFDWGEAGKAWDDPRLDIDDQGDKALLETVSLNRPENEPPCATASCTFDVYVHYYKDWRATSPQGPACPGTPCAEGDECGCGGTSAGAGTVCVSRHCVSPVRPTVRVYVRPTVQSPDPALVLPDPAGGEDLALAGPCFLWHAARVTWPSKDELQRNPAATIFVSQVGSPGSRTFGYYGALNPPSFSCAPNTPAGTPEPDITYLPGTPPTY